MKYYQCVQKDNQNVTTQETIFAIKNAGFDGVFIQWDNKPAEGYLSQEEQLTLCRKLGLEVLFAHLGYKGINNIWLDGEEGDELVKNYLKDLDACKSNNINMVVMHLTSKSVAPEPNLIGVERLQKIVDYAEQLNIKVAFENTKIFGYLEYVFSHIKNSNAGICYDAGHCHCHFNDKFSWDMFKNKIFAVHLHDNDKSDDLHLLPFDGTINWYQLVRNLKNANYNGPITLESCYRYDYLKRSVEDFYKLSLTKAKQINNIMENNKNLFIIHSLNGDTLKFWGEDVKNCFEPMMNVFMPQFSIREKSSYENFDKILTEFLKSNQLNKNSIVICHSIGNPYFIRFCREHGFVPNNYVAVAPGMVYNYPSTRTDYTVEVRKQAQLKQEDFNYAQNFKNVYLLYSDEDDKNVEKFTRFGKDFNAKEMYLKGYNHFDGYHRIYKIPELNSLIEDILNNKVK